MPRATRTSIIIAAPKEELVTEIARLCGKRKTADQMQRMMPDGLYEDFMHHFDLKKKMKQVRSWSGIYK